MQRPFLSISADIMGTGLIVVLFLGLDSLPRDVRRQIETERAALTDAQRQVSKAQDEVTHDLNSDPDLFRSIPASKQWSSDFAAASSDLQSASRDMEQLNALAKKNDRADRDRAVALLSREKNTRTAALD